MTVILSKDSEREKHSGKYQDIVIKDVPITELHEIEAAIANVCVNDNSGWGISIADLDHGAIYEHRLYPYRITRDDRKAAYWAERAAEHGCIHSMEFLFECLGRDSKFELLDRDSKDKEGQYLWACIMKLCKDYESSLKDSDRKIRKELDKDSSSSSRWEKIMPRDNDIKELRSELSTSQLVKIEEEAIAKFAEIKTFIEAQIEAYKMEHGITDKADANSGGIFGNL